MGSYAGTSLRCSRQLFLLLILLKNKYSQSRPPSDPGMCSPRAAQHNVVLPIKEIGYIDISERIYIYINAKLTSIARIYIHRLKTLVLGQWRAGPLPYSAQLALAGEFVAIGSYGDRVPVFEADIGSRKVDKQRILSMCLVSVAAISKSDPDTMHFKSE